MYPKIVTALLLATFVAPEIFAQSSSEDAGKGNDSELISFNRDIRPILSDNCFYCHGPDANHRQADLRMDDRQNAIDQGAINLETPLESEVIKRILSSDAELVMPPPDSHKQLTSKQKELIQRWLEQGAPYEVHWSYQPITKVSVPAGKDPIDFIVYQALQSNEITPAPEADRRTLIRRLYFDLIGLPPTPEQVKEFVESSDPAAYSILVDQLLENPHYGERMAIGWLDAVRYADTIGYHSDNPRNVWPYRDWVIRSFNTNKPFDRFTIEQIAGDLLPDADQETRVGSAFNRLLLSTEEGGAQAKDYEARMLTDRVRAIGTAWLGQTTGCAQCHDHKFDPFTLRDFYSLGAFFADIDEPILGRRENGMPVLDDRQKLEVERLDQAIAELQKQGNGERIAKEIESLKQQKDQLLKEAPTCLVSISSKQPRTVRILPRGNWMDETGEVLKPAFPAYLPSPVREEDATLTRLDLAQWLVSPNNPLTARTVVNRIWKQFFGHGISRILDDLGAQGEAPANQQLLDWLAADFIEHRWNVKRLVRQIVMSEAYRRSSTLPIDSLLKDSLLKDPDNRLFSRQNSFRLDAELVRDNALAVSGLLVDKIGGPSVKPYQPEKYWENLNFPTREYEVDSGESLYRRGLYVWWQRSFLHPSLLAFDAPSREECAADRSRSNIPQQALVLLNDPTYVEAARALAQRVVTESSPEAAKLDRMFEIVLQRKPSEKERTILLTVLAEHLDRYKSDTESAKKLLEVGASDRPESTDAIELAAWTHVARVLLNLHETIVRY